MAIKELILFQLRHPKIAIHLPVSKTDIAIQCMGLNAKTPIHLAFLTLK